MTFTFPLSTTPLPGTVSAVTAAVPPVPATATLSGLSVTSSDPTIFTAALDPSNPLGVIVTAVGAGTANLQASATATEKDGTAHTVTGDATGVVTPAAAAQAASLVFTFGPPAVIS